MNVTLSDVISKLRMYNSYMSKESMNIIISYVSALFDVDPAEIKNKL